MGGLTYDKPTPAETYARLLKIKSLFEQGLSQSQAAEVLGLNKNIVSGIVNRHGHKVGIGPKVNPVPKNSTPPLDRLMAIKPHFDEDLSYAAIGLKLDRTASAVRGDVRRHGHLVGIKLRDGDDRTREAREAPRVTLPPVVAPSPAPAVVYIYKPAPSPARQCQYPLWGNERTKFREDGLPLMCYAPSPLGSSYCAQHRAVCWTRSDRQKAA
jgi:hypothetical protein